MHFSGPTVWHQRDFWHWADFARVNETAPELFNFKAYQLDGVLGAAGYFVIS